VIAIGAVLLILALLIPALHVLLWVGIVLLVIGLCLLLAGRAGHDVGGRSHWY
jgi:membrane-bound ClpP family serine protease